MWMMNQYLMKVPQKQFTNSVGKSLIRNLIESFYALLGISGYQSQNKKIVQNPMQQQIPISGGSKEFQKLESGKTYLINWNKAFFYLVPQLPTHPCRDNVIEIMKRDEPRMLEMYRLQKKFKQEIVKQTQGQGLNQFQIQQRVAVKVQQHMMRNAPNMMPQMQQMQPPTQQQQKNIQIQMITHMITQLQERQPQMTQNLKNLLESLKSNQATPTQVGIALRQIQQEMMKKQMEAVMKQREQMQKAKQQQALKQEQRKDQDEQEQLKKQQVADEDL